MLALLPNVAVAHQATSGWMYGALCCSDRDCHEIMDSAVLATDAGWLVVATGEVIGYDRDTRLKHSGDENFHRCARESSPNVTVCLYVPDSIG